MKTGGVDDMVIAQMLRDGVPLPDDLVDSPELPYGMGLFYNGFHEISSDRAIGMSLGPIPWSAIHLYCKHHTITGEQREDFFFHVHALDAAYRTEVEKQAEKRNKTKGAKNG